MVLIGGILAGHYLWKTPQRFTHFPCRGFSLTIEGVDVLKNIAPPEGMEQGQVIYCPNSLFDFYDEKTI